MRLDIPVDPDAPTARDWLVQELANPRYRAAAPSWFDRLASEFFSWLASLLGSAPGGSPMVFWAVLLALIVAAGVTSYLVFGPPKLGRRQRISPTIFGVTDSRDAAELRRSARLAADNHNWPLAIEESFRAIALMLSERAIFTTSPGTTAAGFARHASVYFPSASDRLGAAGDAFDAVRYLNRPGSENDYRALVALDDELDGLRVDFVAAPGVAAAPGGAGAPGVAGAPGRAVGAR